MQTTSNEDNIEYDNYLKNEDYEIMREDNLKYEYNLTYKSYLNH